MSFDGGQTGTTIFNNVKVSKLLRDLQGAGPGGGGGGAVAVSYTSEVSSYTIPTSLKCLHIEFKGLSNDPFFIMVDENQRIHLFSISEMN